MIGRSALNHKYNRPGVSTKNLLDCLKNGAVGKKQTDARGRGSILLRDAKCYIAINPDTKELLQCNHSRLRR